MAGRNRLEVACDDAGWIHSQRLRCLGFDWSILTNDSALVDYITFLYDGCVDGEPGPAQHVFILRRHMSSDAPSVSVYLDGRAILRRAPADLAIAHVVWHVNRGVVEQAGSRLLLHAAAAERDAAIVVLAGPEGSGKSTLVTALVRSGLRYVTDETVAVELPAATIAPYPKPIALDGGSLGSLRDLAPAISPPLEIALEQRLVPAQAIRPGAIAKRCGAPRLLVLPSYTPGRATAARLIPRAEAAVALAEQAFNLRTLGPGRLDGIAGVVRACDCYQLEVGDLDAACRLVLDLFERAVQSDDQRRSFR
jgi:hypothetical protein